MHPNQTTLETLYTAFARLDADAMAGCYAMDAQFDDEAFSLRGHREVTGMWRMLCGATRSKPASLAAWRLQFSGLAADASGGKAHWEADYLFSATGRMVLNVIDGVFEFNDQAQITRHRDSFNFWRWARPACCWAGRRFCIKKSEKQLLPTCKNTLPLPAPPLERIEHGLV